MITTKVEFIDIGSVNMAYQKIGSGPPVIFLHGWPFNSSSYRKIIPYLEQHLTCYTIDSAGLGNSIWTDKTDFSFPGQAKNFKGWSNNCSCRNRFADRPNS